MKLHVRVTGEGPPLVLIHGWGMHSGAWQPLLPALADRFELHCVDLPGHGRSPPGEADSGLQSWASAVAGTVPPGSAWLGWSLGGQVALAAALAGSDIHRLVLVATTPRFVSGTGWACAMAPDVFAQFARELASNHRRAVRNFLSLQLRGDRRAMALLPVLRRILEAERAPDPRSLALGLEILAATDLRDRLDTLSLPVLVIAGERDRLTPPAAARALAEGLPAGRFELLQEAAHAPFLSRPERFVDCVGSFLAPEPALS